MQGDEQKPGGPGFFVSTGWSGATGAAERRHGFFKLHILAHFDRLALMHGKYVAAIVPPEKNEYFKKAYDTLNGWAQSHPNVKVAYASFTPPELANFVAAESAGMILTFRNVHKRTLTVAALLSGSQKSQFSRLLREHLDPGFS